MWVTPCVDPFLDLTHCRMLTCRVSGIHIHARNTTVSKACSVTLSIASLQCMARHRRPPSLQFTQLLPLFDHFCLDVCDTSLPILTSSRSGTSKPSQMISSQAVLFLALTGYLCAILYHRVVVVLDRWVHRTLRLHLPHPATVGIGAGVRLHPPLVQQYMPSAPARFRLPPKPPPVPNHQKCTVRRTR